MKAIAGTPLLATVFILALAVPPDLSFHIGSFRLTVYRLILLLAFLPLFMRLLGGGCGRLRMVDAAMITYAVWAFAAVCVHHGLERALQSGGVYVLEGLGAYVLARCSVRNGVHFSGYAAVLVALVSLLAVFTIPESITGRHLLRVWVSGDAGERLGFHRAYGPFDHPILNGVFCATAISLAWFAFASAGRPGSRVLMVCWTAISAVTSLSSGAIIAIVTQAGLIGWERLTRKIPKRWLLLCGILGCAYVAIAVFSNRPVVSVFISYLTLTPHTGYYRMEIWRAGMNEVFAHPWFGIGFNDWTRPEWMHSSSMDTFWLLTAVTYGAPTALLLLGTALGMLIQVGRARLTASFTRDARFGWALSTCGFIMAAFTVHYWNALFAFFAFHLGAGVWLLGEGESGGRGRPGGVTYK